MLHVEIIYLYRTESYFKDSSRRIFFLIPSRKAFALGNPEKLLYACLGFWLLSPTLLLGSPAAPSCLHLPRTTPLGTALGRSPAQFFCAGCILFLLPPSSTCLPPPKFPSQPMCSLPAPPPTSHCQPTPSQLHTCVPYSLEPPTWGAPAQSGCIAASTRAAVGKYGRHGHAPII